VSRFVLGIFAVAAFLAGCGGSPPPIAAPGDSLRLPLPSLDDNGTSPLALKTCATRPPQHEWILKGACQAFDLTSTGGHFRLGEYQSITVKGSIGKNTAKGTVKFALTDAIDKNGEGHRRNRSWAHEHPGQRDEAWFKRKVVPKLDAFSLKEIGEATRLSLAACSRIRAGARVPHPRHWDRLLALVEAGN
jgi:hypothetical protein